MSYKVLVADEAIDDIFEFVQYIYAHLCNPDAAERLYHNLNREVKNMGDFPLGFSDSGFEYRGYIIHKKVYDSYLIFYIIDNAQKEVRVLRIIKESMNWQNIMKESNIYHFKL